MGAAPFNLPPPNNHLGRERSPLRRERSREREERFIRDEGRDMERERDRERRSSRLPRDERRLEKRRPVEWRDRDERDRDRMWKDKDQQENLSGLSRSGPSPRRPTQNQGGGLVPYEDDSEGEGGDDGHRFRKRDEEVRRRERSRMRDDRSSSSRRDDREGTSYRDGKEGSSRRDGRGGSSKREGSSRRERRESSSRREEREGGERRKSLDRRNSSPSKEEEPKHLTPEQVIEQEKKVWIRSAPADLYYTRDSETPGLMRATEKNMKMQEKARKVLVENSIEARLKHKVEEPPRLRLGHHHGHEGEEEEGSSSDEDEENPHNHRFLSVSAFQKNYLKSSGLRAWTGWNSAQRRPIVLIQRCYTLPSCSCIDVQVWQNMPGELNDGPACRCSKKARESGIRHGIYVGETPLPDLDMHTNNWSKLYHYRFVGIFEQLTDTDTYLIFAG